MEINIIYITLTAFMGGVAVALLGWTQQGGPWDWKKFLASIVRSLVGAVAIAATLDYSGATAPLVYFIAFLSGTGFEVGGNRIAGAIAGKK